MDDRYRVCSGFFTSSRNDYRSGQKKLYFLGLTDSIQIFHYVKKRRDNKILVWGGVGIRNLRRGGQ